MAGSNSIQAPLIVLNEAQYTNEYREVLLNNDDLRYRNREQLIEKLERVIQEKNASIVKLEEREQHLEDTLKKRNAEFHVLEEKLRQYEEKTRTFEQLHQLQLQTFDKTIHDCQIENERLCEHIHDLTRELREKISFDAINQEKILTFDRIVADVQLWRQKLDAYKTTIEQREETIINLKKEINDLYKKQINYHGDDNNSLRLENSKLQNTLQERNQEIEHLKLTLCHIRDTLQPNCISQDNHWRSCSDNIGRTKPLIKSSEKNRSTSPPQRDLSSPLDVELLKKRFQTLTDRLTNVQQLLVKRDNQIFTLKKVHDKRWVRLKHLQKQYRLLKNELQSYTNDEILRIKSKNDFFFRKAVHKTKTGCSVCDDQQWKKPKRNNKKLLKQEDDDHVWNEITKLRRENTRLTNENLSLQERIDLQDVEINEQTNVIHELHNEIQNINDKNEQFQPTILLTSNNEQEHFREKFDKKIYELERERTCLIFENERLKTNFDLCNDEKQNLTQQKTQINNELRQAKLRILALQDQIHKLNRTNETTNKLDLTLKPISAMQRRINTKKPKRSRMMTSRTTKKSCLELLLEQSSTLTDDFENESSASNRQKQHSCSLCDPQIEYLFKQRKRQSSMSSIRSRHRPLKRNFTVKSHLNVPLAHLKTNRKPHTPSSIQKTPPNRITTLRKRIEQLQTELVNSETENDHLNQRLTSTLSRINMLKLTNQKLLIECDKLRNDHLNQSSPSNYDSTNADSNVNIDNLYERLKNTSFDAAQQRKLNKTLQAENELLTKNVQTLNEKLTHAERDIASKRLLIENYKTRLTEIETNRNHLNEKNINESKDERMKSLNETIDKLRISMDSYKNCLQAVTREKHDLESRYTQLVDEHQQLKIRFDDIQSKFRSIDQQLRQVRQNNEQLNQELITSRRLSEQELLDLNRKSQDSLKKITLELDRALQRLNEYEKFISELLHEMIQRNMKMNEKLKRTRENQKQRESLSMTLPGYDSAMNTASKILNLTQDDIDEIMSMTDESFQVNIKQENVDKDEKIQQKVSKLLLSREECTSKLLKIFSKKLDEIQTVEREWGMIRNT